MSSPQMTPRRILIFGSAMHIWSDLIFALLIPLLPAIKDNLGLTYAEVGLLRSTHSGATAVLQVPAGFLAEYFGEFWMLVTGNLWASAGLIGMGLSNGFWLLFIFAIIGGLGGGTQHPLASSMVSRAYNDSGRSAAVGTVNFSGDLGKMIAPALGGILLITFDWGGTMLYIGAAGIFLMLVTAAFNRNLNMGRPKLNVATLPSGDPLGESPQNKAFISLSFIGALDNATRTGVLVFLPFILVGHGMGTGEISIALFLLFSGGDAGKYVCGWLDGKIGTVNIIWITKGMTAVFVVLSLYTPYLLIWPLVLVMGVGLNGTSSALYATVAKFVPTDRRARYYGFFYTTNEIGTIGAPLLYGFVADVFGLVRSTYVMGLVTFAILPLSLGLRKYLSNDVL
ncbi:MAG TPA: MFS transporter [Dehalococcoidia bacterium]|nr:MFS transporter [Dehalococcoidia bacterium]